MLPIARLICISLRVNSSQLSRYLPKDKGELCNKVCVPANIGFEQPRHHFRFIFEPSTNQTTFSPFTSQYALRCLNRESKQSTAISKLYCLETLCHPLQVNQAACPGKRCVPGTIVCRCRNGQLAMACLFWASRRDVKCNLADEEHDDRKPSNNSKNDGNLRNERSS